MTRLKAPRTLFQERQLFEDSLDELIESGQEGRYVLFKDGKAQAFFDSEQVAHESGLDRYGLEPFLVELILRRRSSWLPPSLKFLMT